MDMHDLERALLKFIDLKGPLKIARLIHPAVDTLKADLQLSLSFRTAADGAQFQEAVWALVSRQLAWIDMSQTHGVELWAIRLTARGASVAHDEQINPEDPTGYMDKLLREVPDTTEVVGMYLREALNAYVQHCYLSSAVMLGVAAEACMLETASAYVQWAGSRADKLRDHLDNARTFYVAKLQEFQKRLATDKSQFPDDLADALELDVTAVLQLIRLTRNDAGHPTGRKIDRDACFNHLIVYARTHKRLHALKHFFAS
jgi:hypothetical protein